MPPLRICAYNVLAQALATSSYFKYAKGALKKATRLPRILARISALSPDILCLSEAFPEVVELLAGQGYATCYKARAGRPYGICLAWRSSLLECVHAAATDLDDVAECLGQGGEGGEGGAWPAQDALPVQTFRTNSLALFAALRFRAVEGEGGSAAGAPFAVGTTHLFWDPRFEGVKAAQAVALKLCAAEFAAEHSPGRPLLLGGDFNSLPHSWVCQVLGGAFPPAPAGSASAQWDVLAREPSERPAEGVQAWHARLRARLHGELGAPIPLRMAQQPPPPAGPCLQSLYALAGSGQEPEITTFTDTFAETIDYIFALQGSCDLSALVCTPVPTKAQLAGPIPSEQEPSDHLPLCAQLSV